MYKIIAIKKPTFGLLGWLHIHTQLPLFLSISSKEMALMILTIVPQSRIRIIFEALTENLKIDKDIVMLSLGNAHHHDVYHILTKSKSLKEDKDVMLLALLKTTPNDTSYVLAKSKTLINDRDVVLFAINKSNYVGRQKIYASLNKTLQDDPEITSIYLASLLRKTKGSTLYL
ncbi:MAG: hypothetical protein WCH76_00610 [Candidatus Riflemargulisbacteria bacterium]